jgi:aminopeptidase N
VPSAFKEKDVEDFQLLIYSALNRIPMQWPIDIPSEEFPNDEEYASSTYIKTAVWMHLMEVNFGKDKFDKAMQSYFSEWKFKHPYPEDLRASLEESIGVNLREFFEMLKKRGSL